MTTKLSTIPFTIPSTSSIFESLRILLGGKGVEAEHEDVKAVLVDVSSLVDLSPAIECRGKG